MGHRTVSTSIVLQGNYGSKTCGNPLNEHRSSIWELQGLVKSTKTPFVYVQLRFLYFKGFCLARTSLRDTFLFPRFY